MIEFDNGKMREWRKAKGLKQSEVAREIGCTPTTLSRWELGLSPITAEMLARLASLYGYSTEAAFYRSIANGTVQEAGGQDISNGKDDQR